MSETIQFSHLKDIVPEERKTSEQNEMMKSVYANINGDKGRFRMTPRRILQAVTDLISPRR